MKMGIGKDSHKFLRDNNGKKCIIGGVTFEESPGWDADSDGDIAFHAICNAISSITHVPSMGGFAIEMCKDKGITNSAEYLKKAVETLGERKVVHVALTIEAKSPKLQPKIDVMRANIAKQLGVEVNQVGITCNSGNGLNDLGKGEGGECTCILTVT